MALAGCASAEAKRGEPEAPPVVVKLATVHTEPLEARYRASGTVRWRTTAVLTSKTTGYVRSVDVRPGEGVRAGQVLATLEANDSAASVRRARAGLDQSTESRAEAENGRREGRQAARAAAA
jgi:multidrug efflux pump subunit AcrA (membrane-fusion protein)